MSNQGFFKKWWWLICAISKPSVRVDNEVTDVRKIDISNTILYKLRDATPIESGRTLEF